MAQLKVKAVFISNNNERGVFEKMELEYLIRANSFGDGEKAILEVVKRDENPKDKEVRIVRMDPYQVEDVIYKRDNEYEPANEDAFYEVVIETIIHKRKGTKIYRTKYLIEAESVEDARRYATKHINNKFQLFDEEKVFSVKKTKIYFSFL